ISITVELECPAHYAPDTPLAGSKNYLDLKHAAITALPEGVHFKLVEAVADHIADTLIAQDARVRWVRVKIVKLVISENGESIGITLLRHRR
ncbi:MAG: dihydroneopterin aldolase, partial [Sphingomonas sp.]|nr:dihydroneopterin aldolase [Sphingomonas sp.]